MMYVARKSNKVAEDRMTVMMNSSMEPAMRVKITLAKHVTCLTTSHRFTSLMHLIQSAPSSGESLVKMSLKKSKQARTVAA